MMTPLISVGLCASITLAVAVVAARMLWRDHVALSAAEWDAHVDDVLDVCADAGRDDFASWAREMGA